ncbi:MAG: FAD-binding oxidoreductase [Cyanobacteria bacterium SZAS LIN-2]|nr:FAD-binding oxidoreductase [Cyanobacteria bacterium SZAS LIN-2]
MTETFHSFDGGVTVQSVSGRPSELSLKGLSDMEEKLLAGRKLRIARGAGLNFSAASFAPNSVSVVMASFRNILGFDKEKGIIEVEAGATMGDIYNYLLDHNRYLLPQPGYPSITTGGCIAVDVHGKNQFKDGNFSDYVESVKLLHPAYGVIEVSERFNKEVFELTLGGYGLTGHILSAKLKTKVIPGAQMELSVDPIELLEQTPEMIEKAARHCDFTVSWHDLTGEGKAFGRGFLINGVFKKGSTGLSKLTEGHYVDSDNRSGLGLSFYSLPFTRLMNVMYSGLRTMRPEAKLVPIHECLYPSRRLRDMYYKMFGPQGFCECQMIVPVEHFEEYTAALRDWLSRHELPITLASGKFFHGQQKLLRFSGKGICFALNFPRTPAAAEFLLYLDQLAMKLDLIPYIAKDSRLPLEVVRHCYKDYDKFKERLRKYDRERLFSSEVSQRLGL